MTKQRPCDAKISRPDTRATSAQVAYLRRLLDRAFSLRIPTYGFDRNHLDHIRRGEASSEITRLRALLDGAK